MNIVKKEKRGFALLVISLVCLFVYVRVYERRVKRETERHGLT